MLESRTMRILALLLCLLAAPLLSGCGFTPVYATGDNGDGPPLKGVKLAGVEASETAAPILTRAFLRRTALASDAVEYDLIVSVKESAQPLAVQIDDSVTRYNYRLEATYTLTQRSDGKEFKGQADAVASFNVVSSQYSTLFAEQAAREKAARVLADEVERDILLKFAAARQADAGAAPVR
ncbi:MAG: LPS assembly lipoprotein LptE [Parvularculaceae bacterium]